ncbi:hypothetical protein R5R35_005161 [Gryllus longicercus]|uniref:Uncharacterized protein n=1 Tax=Gryllus longicercus TaxID=2509291 RepID=A0AAN9V6B8_9ORTH
MHVGTGNSFCSGIAGWARQRRRRGRQGAVCSELGAGAGAGAGAWLGGALEGLERLGDANRVALATRAARRGRSNNRGPKGPIISTVGRAPVLHMSSSQKHM